MLRTALIVFLSAFSVSVFAQDNEGLRFTHKDWSLVCENVQLCHATGRMKGSNTASVMLTRKTDAAGQASVSLIFSDTHASDNSPQLTLGGQAAGMLTREENGQFAFTASQVSGALQALLHDKQIQIAQPDQAADLSGEGINAVLLKMDDFQGLLDTPAAFVPRADATSKPDDDSAAQDELFAALQKEKNQNNQMPVETLMSRYASPETQVTRFDITYEGEEKNTLPKKKPSADITDDEWQAFQKSNVVVFTENQTASYTLVDLDGDGKRDLIIDAYIGGTGIFTYTGILKRGKGTFYSTVKADPDASVPGYLYSTNARGANQAGYWIRLNKQIYLAYRVSYFGVDNIYLLRPFSHNASVAKITVTYRYALSVTSPDPRDKETPWLTLSDKQKVSVGKSLAALQAHPSKAGSSASPAVSVCPVPPSLSQNEAGFYGRSPVPGYEVQAIGDIPVWIDEQCYVGGVYSHFGDYSPKEGVDIMLYVYSPQQDGELKGDISVFGKREVVAIERARGAVQGDNGR